MKLFIYLMQSGRIGLHLLAKAGLPLVGLIFESLVQIGQLIVSVWRNMPALAKRLAEKWIEVAVGRDFDSRYSDHLYHAFWGVAILSLVAGWIATAYLIVFAFNRLLR